MKNTLVVNSKPGWKLYQNINEKWKKEKFKNSLKRKIHEI